MDETDWLTSADPLAILQFVRSQISDRKSRLFVVACCRAVWGSFASRRTRRAVEAAEGYADGRVPEHTLHFARSQASQAVQEAFSRQRRGGVGHAYIDSTERRMLLAQHAAEADITIALGDLDWIYFDAQIRRISPVLLRDLVGNPFRPRPPLDPGVLAWQEATVARLAAATYEHRELPSGRLDPHRLAVLADALEESGADAELVGHLREPGPHVRGCWCVDLLTGRE